MNRVLYHSMRTWVWCSEPPLKKKVRHTCTFFWNPPQQWEGRDRQGHAPGSFTCSSMRSRPMRDPVSRAKNGDSSWGLTSDSNLWLWLGWADGSFTQAIDGSMRTPPSHMVSCFPRVTQLAITQSRGGRYLAAVLFGALLQAMHHTLTGQGLGDPAMQNPLTSRQAILMGFLFSWIAYKTFQTLLSLLLFRSPCIFCHVPFPCPSIPAFGCSSPPLGSFYVHLSSLTPAHFFSDMALLRNHSADL